MAQLGINTCEPARIYGPLSPTIFCGCSVKSFSISTGWNEQASSLTVELVEDSCAGKRIWWDESLNRQVSESMADPGFIEPEPGCAAYFRVEEYSDGSTEAERGGFEYCGIIESWNRKKDAGNNPTYTVKLTDPRAILENSQVIVNDFPGTTSGVWNMINAYAYVESLGGSCGSSPAGGFGGVTGANSTLSIANDRGMIWGDVRCAIHTLTSSVDRSLASSLYGGYCKDGRLVNVGPTEGNDGYGIIKKDNTIIDPVYSTIQNANTNVQYYTVDLTEIPFTPISYRISGPNISIMEIISQVCQDAGCDYYVELLPIKNGSSVIKMIKVRVAVRSSQPQLGRLDDFIQAKQDQASGSNGGVISYTQGSELRNEETSFYLIGANRRDPFEADSTQVLPFWGLDTDGNLIQATVSNGQYFVRLDLARLNASLYTPFTSQYKWISEMELRAAMSDIDSWKLVTQVLNGDFWTYLNNISQPPIVLARLLGDVIDGKKGAHAAYAGLSDSASLDKINEESAKDLDKVYEFVSNYANEFYGKQFIVNAPFVCYAIDNETNKYKFSHMPSTEGCWVEDSTDTVIGLIHNSLASDFFREDNGVYNPILKFPLINATDLTGAGSHTADPSKLNDDNYITDAVDEIWVKADVDPNWVIGTPLSPSSSTASFLLKIDSPVVKSANESNYIPNFLGAAAAVDPSGNVTLPNPKVLDRSSIAYGSFPASVIPSAALCPTLNKVQVYGPWGVAGLPGQVHLETDEGYSPWEYGSDTVMYRAALEKVANAVTQMRKGERGSITVAGFPNIPIGAELFSVDTVNPPESMGAKKYVGTRTYSTDQCSLYIPYIYCEMNAWTGEFGPNVTNVNVQVGENGFTTDYQFSTYTPQFGRFNKDNSERLKKVGQNRLQSMRNMRAQANLKNNIRGTSARAQSRYVEKQQSVSSRSPRSANHFLVGGYCDSGTGRPEINSQGVRDVSLGISSDERYSKTAVMSMDGMYRPVSKSGDGELSRFISYTTGCPKTRHMSKMPDPPYKEYTPVGINQAFIDPISNPSSKLLTTLSDTPTEGHDIEVLGRNATPPGSGWAIKEGEEAGVGGYADDYRFFALRGPMMIQQWGFDLAGKPVPNKADDEDSCKLGVFTDEGLKDKFLDGWLQKPKTWPVGILDLRLDRERGVWTVPPPPRTLHVTPVGSCLLDTPEATVDNAATVYDSDGTEVASPTVDVAWPWTINPPTDIGRLPVYFDTQDCVYYAYPINRFDVAEGSDINTISNNYQDIKRIIFSNTVGAGGSSCASSSTSSRFVLQTNFDQCTRDIFVSISGGGGNISGIDGAGNCAGSSLGTTSPFSTIAFGTGLRVRAIDSCAYRVDVNLFAYGSDDACGAGSPVGPKVPNYLVFGSGLISSYDEGSCNFTVNSSNRIESIGADCYPVAGPFQFELLQVSGLGLTTNGNGCQYVIEHKQYLSKTAGCEVEVGSELDGESSLSERPFNTLNFSTGLRVIENVVEGDCTYDIMGGIKVSARSCGAGFDDFDDWFSRIKVGSGLEALRENDSDCQVTIHAPIAIESSTIAGQTFTKTSSCVSGAPTPTFICTSGQCGQSLVDTGPYCDRIPPKYVTEIWAGRGIGITSCSECQLILFNNHRDIGISGDCSPVEIGQVGVHTWSHDFELEGGGESGGACDGLDETLDTSIKLSEGGGDWSFSMITSITCIKDGPYITSISCGTDTISGKKSCNDTYWIRSITNEGNTAGCTACS